MPLLDRIRAFLSGPQGRRPPGTAPPPPAPPPPRLTDQGRRYASDPRNQRRARDLFARLRRR